MSKNRIIGMLLALLVSISAGCSKTESGPPPESSVSEITLESPTNGIIMSPENPPEEKPHVQIEGFDCICVEVGDECLDCAYKNEDGIYLNVETFMRLCGAEEALVYCDGTELKINCEGILALYTARGDHYISVNGRYIYSPIDFVCLSEGVYFTADVICKLFNVQMGEADGTDTLKLDIGNMGIIQGGEYYYDVNFSGDDIYWLSHIIQAEADTQPLAGMIGVGNVVLNRVNSEQFPDSIFDVIFEYQSTAQFTPKTSTALSRTVIEKVQIATYLCLEGYNTVGDSLFFQNPLLAETSWIAQAREFAIRIGDVDFYY